MKKELGITVLLLVLCAVTAILNPAFIKPFNLVNNANMIGLYGVFSIGLGLVIITGGIDLSVGSMCALTGVLLAMALSEWHWPWPLAVLSVLTLSGLLGWAHGWLVTRMNLQPFIVTLCGLLIYRGLARFIAHDSTKGFVGATGIETLKFLASGRLFRVGGSVPGKDVFPGIPMPFLILVFVTVAMWFVLHRSVYGRYLLAVGRNESAARFSGINTRLVITSAYVIGGILTGISGIMISLWTNSVSPSSHANTYEMYGIAAAVLGGCSLRGGEGSILGIVIGTALLVLLQNLVILLHIEGSLNYTVMGGVVLVGVLVDELFQRRAKKKLLRQGS